MERNNTRTGMPTLAELRMVGWQTLRYVARWGDTDTFLHSDEQRAAAAGRKLERTERLARIEAERIAARDLRASRPPVWANIAAAVTGTVGRGTTPGIVHEMRARGAARAAAGDLPQASDQVEFAAAYVMAEPHITVEEVPTRIRERFDLRQAARFIGYAGKQALVGTLRYIGREIKAGLWDEQGISDRAWLTPESYAAKYKTTEPSALATLTGDENIEVSQEAIEKANDPHRTESA